MGRFSGKVVAVTGGASGIGRAVVLALALLWTGDYSPRLRWTLTAILVFAWLGFTRGPGAGSPIRAL